MQLMIKIVVDGTEHVSRAGTRTREMTCFGWRELQPRLDWFYSKGEDKDNLNLLLHVLRIYMLDFEDSVVNKMNTVPSLETLRNRRQTNNYISRDTLQSSSSGIPEGSTEGRRCMGIE